MRSGLLTDWAWRPDLITRQAIKRGGAKFKRLLEERREALINFNLVARRRLTKHQQRSLELDRAQVRAYLERISPPAGTAAAGATGLGRPPGVSHGNNESHETDGKRSRTAVRGRKRHTPQLARKQRLLADVAGMEKGRRMQQRRTAERTQRAGRTFRGSAMNWATIVIQGMNKTRAHSRHDDEQEAVAAAEKLPTELRDYVVVSAETVMSAFSHLELDALLKQFGDPRRGLDKEQKEAAVKHYLEQFEPSRHGPDGKVLEPYEQAQVKPKSKRQSEAQVETQTATGKRRGTAKSGKLKAGKKAKVKAKGNGAPRKEREGTPAHFIREGYRAGKDTDTIFEQVKKKFPKNKIKNKSYVSWYYNKMIQNGEIKKH